MDADRPVNLVVGRVSGLAEAVDLLFADLQPPGGFGHCDRLFLLTFLLDEHGVSQDEIEGGVRGVGLGLVLSVEFNRWPIHEVRFE